MSDSFSRKIVGKEELLAIVRAARAAGHTIVHCHGCFDIVHPGHVRYLEFARRQGDLLVVSLTGDSQITKGVQRPYIPEELRAENLAALEAVDLVYINPEPDARNLLDELRPDIYVKGREYEESRDPGFLAERQTVESYGGRVLFSSGDVVFSSTRLIEFLARRPVLQVERLAAICRRHGIRHRSMAALMSSFARLHVLVVGDLILDRYVLCDATSLASEAPMISLSRLEERLYVGGAGAVARHVAGLGARAFLLTAAGEDRQSLISRRILEDESIESRFINCRPRLPEKTRYLVETTKLFRVEDAEALPLDSVAEQQAAGWVQDISSRIDAVIFCDFGYGTITRGLLERLRTIIAERGCVVSADASGARSRLLEFADATLLCPSERELRSCLHDYQSGLSKVAWNALQHTRARQMIVTLGKEGLVAFDRQSADPANPRWNDRLRSEHLPALSDRVIDPLGCGEAVLTAASLALAAGGTLLQAAYLGSAAAALEAEKLGNMPVEQEEIERWLSARHELIEAEDDSRRAERIEARLAGGARPAVPVPSRSGP